jgi:hypothetical protein
MSSYQQLFSTNAVLSVWRNIRHTKDHNDLLLSFQYNQDDARGQKGKKYRKSGAVENTQEVADGKAVDVGGKSIGFVVPWRSMQAQRRELKEKEKELAEALVALAGEMAFTGMYLVYVHLWHRFGLVRVCACANVCYRSFFYPPMLSHAEPTHSDPPSCGRPFAPNVEDRNTNGGQCALRKRQKPIYRRRDSTKVSASNTNVLRAATSPAAYDLRALNGAERSRLHGHGRLRKGSPRMGSRRLSNRRLGRTGRRARPSGDTTSTSDRDGTTERARSRSQAPPQTKSVKPYFHSSRKTPTTSLLPPRCAGRTSVQSRVPRNHRPGVDAPSAPHLRRLRPRHHHATSSYSPTNSHGLHTAEDETNRPVRRVRALYEVGWHTLAAEWWV